MPKKKKKLTTVKSQPPSELEIQTLTDQFISKCSSLSKEEVKKLIKEIGIDEAKKCLDENNDCLSLQGCLKRKQQEQLTSKRGGSTKDDQYDASKVK